MARRKKKHKEVHRVTLSADEPVVPATPASQRAEFLKKESPVTSHETTTPLPSVDIAPAPRTEGTANSETPLLSKQPTASASSTLSVNEQELAEFEAELTLKHEHQRLVEEAVKQALEERAVLREREVDAAEYEAEAKRWQQMLLVSTTPDSLVQYLNFYKTQWDLDSLITAGRVAQRALESHQKRVLVYQFAFAVVGVAVGYYSWYFDILHKNNASY